MWRRKRPSLSLSLSGWHHSHHQTERKQRGGRKTRNLKEREEEEEEEEEEKERRDSHSDKGKRRVYGRQEVVQYTSATC